MAFRKDIIKHGDALELLKTVPDGSAALVIADPPYNLGPAFGVETEWRHSPDWLPWCKEWLSECVRLLDDDGQIFVYGIHHYIGYVQVLLYELGLQYRRQIIWHYENGWSRTRTISSHPLRAAARGSRSRTATRSMRSVSRTRAPNDSGTRSAKTGRFGYPTLTGDSLGTCGPSRRSLVGGSQNERVDHPTQKPLSLTNRLVEHFTNPGDLIVVPFVGSGTECVSAAVQGRHYWGVDLNPDYVELATTRVAQAVQEAQLDLRPAGSEGATRRP